MRLSAEKLQIPWPSPRLVDFSLESGVHWLCGPNGSGKSTLLRVLAGLLPSSAKLEDAGSSAQWSRLPIRQRARIAGFLSQNPSFGQYPSVREFLRAPWTNGIVSDAEASFPHMLDHWSLHDLLDRVPESLSTGEQRRLFLARLFAVPRKLFFLDEPLPSLDIHWQRRVEDHVRSLGKSGSLVILSHHTPMLRVEPRDGVILLSRNHFSCIGPGNEGLMLEKFETVFGVPFARESGWIVPRY